MQSNLLNHFPFTIIFICVKECGGKVYVSVLFFGSTILAGIIERMEHVNQGMITLKLEYKRLRQKHYLRPSYTMDSAISEVNKDEEYIAGIWRLKMNKVMK